MKNILASLLFIPLLAVANNNTAIVKNQNQIEVTDIAKSVDHSKWDALLRKHVSANGNEIVANEILYQLKKSIQHSVN